MEKREGLKRGEITQTPVDREVPRNQILADVMNQLVRLHGELPGETKLRMTTLAKREGVAEDVRRFVRSMVIQGAVPYAREGDRTKEEMMPEINAFLLALAKELPSKSERGDGDPSPGKEFILNLRGRRVPPAPGADSINRNSGRDMYRYGLWKSDGDWED